MQKSRLVIALSAALVTASCASTQSTVAQSTTTHKAPTPATLKADHWLRLKAWLNLPLSKSWLIPTGWVVFPQTRFDLDGQDILFYQKREGSEVRDLMIIKGGQGKPQAVPLSEQHLYIADEKSSVAGDWLAYTYKGNVFVRFGNGEVKQLTRDSERQHNLQAMADGSLSYQQGQQFFRIDVRSGLSQQMADIQFADEPQANEAPADYIAKEEQKLIQFVQKERKNRAEQFEYQQQLQQQNDTLAPQAFYLDKRMQWVDGRLSPNGRYLLVAMSEPQVGAMTAISCRTTSLKMAALSRRKCVAVSPMQNLSNIS